MSLSGRNLSPRDTMTPSFPQTGISTQGPCLAIHFPKFLHIVTAADASGLFEDIMWPVQMTVMCTPAHTVRQGVALVVDYELRVNGERMAIHASFVLPPRQ